MQILSTWNHRQSARLVWNHYRACSPMLQALGNLAGCPWLIRHFQRLWNKVVLGPNSSDRTLIVTEKSKSVVFLGNMKCTNLLSSVVPSFLNSRLTFFSLGHCSQSTLKISSPVKGLECFVILWYVFECFNRVIDCTLGKYRVFFRVFFFFLAI